MTVSLYVALKEMPEEEAEEFISSLKEYLASKYAGKAITIIFNQY